MSKVPNDSKFIGEIKCSKCGRTYNTGFMDCPFCDLKYDVVHGQ